jgi:hypothetical protein
MVIVRGLLHFKVQYVILYELLTHTVVDITETMKR